MVFALVCVLCCFFGKVGLFSLDVVFVLFVCLFTYIYICFYVSKKKSDQIGCFCLVNLLAQRITGGF